MARNLVSLAVTAFLLAAPASAEPYRLVIGDRVIVNYDFLQSPKKLAVDIDGQIRLSELGSIDASGLTLNEVQKAIADGMVAGGFNGVSFVSVEVDSYAPLVVAGFVESSGRYDYIPGITVGSAVALAGGAGRALPGETGTELRIFTALRRANLADDEITQATVSIAGLEAALTGPEATVTLSEAARASVPADRRIDLELLIAQEAVRLEAERSRSQAQLDSWGREIGNFTAQIQLLDGRIAVKRDVIAGLELELTDLETLRTQGLATTARTSSLQQRLGDDREEMLAMEIAKVQAGHNRGLAERARNDFVARERGERLAALHLARAKLAAAVRESELVRQEIVLLGAQSGFTGVVDNVVDLRFEVQGPRAARFDGVQIDQNTPLLPGDVLVVLQQTVGNGG